MFDPPIDNWTQADEDCFECKHRLALGDELTKLRADLAEAQSDDFHLYAHLRAERGLRLAMERQAIGIDDAGRARINDAKAILTEAMRANRVQPWPKAGILGLCKQVAQTLAHWSGVIGSRDQALKEAHDRRRFFKKKYEETLVHLTNAEEGLQQLQEFVQADSNDTRLREMKLDKTGLMIAVENNFGIKLLVWNLLAMTEACQNYLQTEVQPEFNAAIETGYDRAWRYFLTVVKPGGKSPHELRAEAEAERDFLRAERDAVRAELEQLRAEAQTEMPEEVSIEVLQPREQPCQGCGITNKPLNRRFLCSGCLAIIGLTAENARLRATRLELENWMRARLALADRLAEWIEGRVEEDHPEACAGRLCICQTLAAYRASAEVLHA